MKRRDFMIGTAAMAALRLAKAQTGGSCQVLDTDHVTKKHPNIIHLSILRPGSYCLDQDWSQRKLGWLAHFGTGDTDMLRLYCGHVTVDMQGHALACNYERSGITLDTVMNRDRARRGTNSVANPSMRYSEDSLDNRFVTIRNGTIDLTGGEQTGIGCHFRNIWGSGFITNPFIPARPRNAAPDNFTRNEYLLDNLKIHTLGIGVMLEGSHNVIRNCVVHSQGQAAVVGAGPDLTIESCEIWLKPSAGEHHVRADMPRAAIHLRDGSRAVIRNNVIRLSESDGNTPPAILIRDGASDVLIENNTFVNASGDPVVLADNSSAIVRDNKIAQRWVPW